MNVLKIVVAVRIISFLTIILLTTSCTTKSQNLLVEFPINCSNQEIIGDRMSIVQGELSLLVPDSYSLIDDTISDDQVMLLRTIPYKPEKGVVVDIFKTDQSLSLNEIITNIEASHDTLTNQSVLKEKYHINALKNIKHFAYSYVYEFKDNKTAFTSIHFLLNGNVYGIWISHYEALGDFDYKGYCEIINILATLREE